MMITLLTLFANLVFIEAAFLNPCGGINNCDACVRTESLQLNCKWCPINEQCYNPWFPFGNPCRSFGNENSCAKLTTARPLFHDELRYSESLAKEIAYLSAVAYSNVPENCFRQTEDFELLSTFESDCDLVGNKCFAYLARSRKRNVTALLFRGTNSNVQLAAEFVRGLVSALKPLPHGGSVQPYFANALHSLWPCIASELHNSLSTENLWLGGHSLGGALASIAAYTVANQGLWEKNRINLVTLGMPRVGNAEYAQIIDRSIPNTWRIVHSNDVVPHLPFCRPSFNGCSNGTNDPFHHGIEIWYPMREKMTLKKGEYKICVKNEDLACSNSISPHFTVKDHSFYFEKLDVSCLAAPEKRDMGPILHTFVDGKMKTCSIMYPK